MLSGELGGGGRSVDRYGLIDGFATSIEAAPQTLDGRTEKLWDGRGRRDGHGLRRKWDGASGAPTKEGEGGRRERYVQKGTEGRLPYRPQRARAAAPTDIARSMYV